MILPIADLEDWCKAYALTPKELQCSSCKRRIITSVPVAVSGYRGLMAECNDCKETLAIMKPVSKEKKDFWTNTI
ncbi:hypothetical protein BDW_02320 [Bdellovibrio bacteriovorus W]|nr:hypothetical protein BDW_02320 [Bdellovibrio bacteriovorus W]